MSTNDVEEIKEGIRNIESLLRGNPLNERDEGILGKLDNVAADVEVLKEARKKVGWIIAGATAAFTILFAVLEALFKLYTTK